MQLSAYDFFDHFFDKRLLNVPTVDFLFTFALLAMEGRFVGSVAS